MRLSAPSCAQNSPCSDRNGKIQENIEFDPESRSFLLDFFTSGLLLLFSVPYVEFFSIAILSFEILTFPHYELLSVDKVTGDQYVLAIWQDKVVGAL